MWVEYDLCAMWVLQGLNQFGLVSHFPVSSARCDPSNAWSQATRNFQVGLFVEFTRRSSAAACLAFRKLVDQSAAL